MEFGHGLSKGRGLLQIRSSSDDRHSACRYLSDVPPKNSCDGTESPPKLKTSRSLLSLFRREPSSEPQDQGTTGITSWFSLFRKKKEPKKELCRVEPCDGTAEEWVPPVEIISLQPNAVPKGQTVDMEPVGPPQPAPPRVVELRALELQGKKIHHFQARGPRSSNTADQQKQAFHDSPTRDKNIQPQNLLPFGLHGQKSKFAFKPIPSVAQMREVQNKSMIIPVLPENQLPPKPAPRPCRRKSLQKTKPKGKEKIVEKSSRELVAGKKLPIGLSKQKASLVSFSDPSEPELSVCKPRKEFSESAARNKIPHNVLAREPPTDKKRKDMIPKLKFDTNVQSGEKPFYGPVPRAPEVCENILMGTSCVGQIKPTENLQQISRTEISKSCIQWAKDPPKKVTKDVCKRSPEKSPYKIMSIEDMFPEPSREATSPKPAKSVGTMFFIDQKKLGKQNAFKAKLGVRSASIDCKINPLLKDMKSNFLLGKTDTKSKKDKNNNNISAMRTVSSSKVENMPKNKTCPEFKTAQQMKVGKSDSFIKFKSSKSEHYKATNSLPKEPTDSKHSNIVARKELRHWINEICKKEEQIKTKGMPLSTNNMKESQIKNLQIEQAVLMKPPLDAIERGPKNIPLIEESKILQKSLQNFTSHISIKPMPEFIPKVHLQAKSRNPVPYSASSLACMKYLQRASSTKCKALPSYKGDREEDIKRKTEETVTAIKYEPHKNPKQIIRQLDSNISQALGSRSSYTEPQEVEVSEQTSPQRYSVPEEQQKHNVVAPCKPAPSCDQVQKYEETPRILPEQTNGELSKPIVAELTSELPKEHIAKNEIDKNYIARQVKPPPSSDIKSEAPPPSKDMKSEAPKLYTNVELKENQNIALEASNNKPTNTEEFSLEMKSSYYVNENVPCPFAKFLIETEMANVYYKEEEYHSTCGLSAVAQQSTLQKQFMRSFSNCRTIHLGMADNECKSVKKDSGSNKVDSDKEKTKKKGKDECLHISLPGCQKPKTTVCRAQSKKLGECIKTPPPMPSYAECIRDETPEHKYTECNLKRDPTCEAVAKRLSYDACNPPDTRKKSVCPPKSVQGEKRNKPESSENPVIVTTNKKPSLSKENEKKKTASPLNSSASSSMNCSSSTCSVNQLSQKYYFPKRYFSQSKVLQNPEQQSKKAKRNKEAGKEKKGKCKITGDGTSTDKIRLHGCKQPDSTICPTGERMPDVDCDIVYPPRPSYTECLKEDPPYRRAGECSTKTELGLTSLQKKMSFDACDPPDMTRLQTADSLEKKRSYDGCSPPQTHKPLYCPPKKKDKKINQRKSRTKVDETGKSHPCAKKSAQSLENDYSYKLINSVAGNYLLNQASEEAYFSKRYYSSGSKGKQEKLQKMTFPQQKSSKKKDAECLKINLPGCKVPTTTVCRAKTKKLGECKKVSAPMPSYAECIKEPRPELKYTECNLKRDPTCGTEQKRLSYDACNPPDTSKKPVCPPKLSEGKSSPKTERKGVEKPKVK